MQTPDHHTHVCLLNILIPIASLSGTDEWYTVPANSAKLYLSFVIIVVMSIFCACVQYIYFKSYNVQDWPINCLNVIDTLQK